MYDAIVVGAGHNGLVTAGYLARVGWKVLVLERRPLVGGACVTEEVFPGYRVSTAAYLVSLMQERVVRDLELRRFGYDVLPKEPAYFAPHLDGRYLFMYADQHRTREALARFSAKDAERYPAYEQFVERLARFMEPLLLQAPPNLPPRTPADFQALARLGWHVLRRPPAEIGQIVRMFCGSAREVLDDWFESDELKLALATDGVIGTNGGPSTPGTAYVLLHHVMGGVGGVRGLWGFVSGGMGSLTEALRRSAEAHGAEVQTDADVARIEVVGGRATGVTLRDGRDFQARVVVSNADPSRTFLGLIEPRELPSEFVKQIEAYRCEGSSFKINLALGELPSYSALPGTSPGPQHRGTTHICASLDSLEHAWDEARSGTPSSEPLLEITIPTVYDRSLAPDGKHILSIFAQYAPYRLRDGQWDAATRGAFVERVIGLLEQYAPNIRGSIEHVHALSPLDLEQEYGLTGGNIFHGELRLDQLFALRPVAGWARYATPVVGLYLCGSGTHPGGGVTGAPGHNAAQVILRSAKQGQKSYALFLANNPTMEARHGRRSIAER
ncbi:MAG: NAD(P)/FAD-dependent oxidoreductase [Chloroflexi bacterium]|nr:NAD(P)/FAD-dependent oxidoreductase [Chloroflexota bacterium]